MHQLNTLLTASLQFSHDALASAVRQRVDVATGSAASDAPTLQHSIVRLLLSCGVGTALTEDGAAFPLGRDAMASPHTGSSESKHTMPLLPRSQAQAALLGVELPTREEALQSRD